MRNIFRNLSGFVFCLWAALLQAELQYEVLYTFPSLRNEVRTQLLRASDGNFYGGAKKRDDTWDHGVLFRLKSNGQYDVLYTFNGEDGSQVRSPLIQAKDGFLYGVTFSGGDFNRGTVFRCSIEGQLTTLHSFSTTDGSYLTSSLLEVREGVFWGVAKNGGEHNFGTIYQISSAGEFEIIHEFSGEDGREPTWALVPHRNGAIYGVTRRGGAENEGVIFKIDANGQLKTIYSFIEEENRFTAGLVAGDDGLVYGTMNQGGTQNLGSIFKIDDEDTVITHFSFRQESGSSPNNTLMNGPGGFLYGISRNSADSTNSQIYKIHPDGRFSVIKRFTESIFNRDLSYFSDSQLLYWGNRRYSDTSTRTFTAPVVLELFENEGKREFLLDVRGRFPSSGLMKGMGSLFYGVTSSGGDGVAANGFDFGLGTLYSFDASSKILTTLHRFSEEDGTYPNGDLIEVDPGVFFGVTRNGGQNNSGVVYRFNRNTNDYKVIHSFPRNHGRRPRHGLVMASDGLLYGTTPEGSRLAQHGTLFSIHPQKERVEESYVLGSEHAPISSKLIHASDGLLYGVANYYGERSGAIIRFDPKSENITTLYNFERSDGRTPRGALLETSDGVFYGTAKDGGEFDEGTVFRFDLNRGFEVLYSFSEFPSGYGNNPQFTLVKGRSGVLFGLTNSTWGHSSLFRVDERGEHQLLHEFNVNSGKVPAGSLIGLEDNSFLGTARSGGINNSGVIYLVKGIDELIDFRRGDSNTNGTLEIADGLLILEYLFLKGVPLSCWDASDSNDDGTLSISDSIFLFHSLFFGGVLNRQFCTQDQTQDLLTCYEVNWSCKE